MTILTLLHANLRMQKMLIGTRLLSARLTFLRKGYISKFRYLILNYYIWYFALWNSFYQLKLLLLTVVTSMNFFADDFGLSDSPRPKIGKSAKKSETNKSNKGIDQFDDLLDELMVKQKKKTNKPNPVQVPSFTSLGNLDKNQLASAKPSINQTKRWDTFDNINLGIKNNSDFGKTYQPLRDRTSSVHDQKKSQDGRSMRSGARASVAGGFDPQAELRSIQNLDTGNDSPIIPSRGMMKPPLRKRGQSRAGSQMGSVDDFGTTIKIPDVVLPSMQEIDSSNFMRPPLPRRQPSIVKSIPQSATEIKLKDFAEPNEKPQIIEKQKIVYVKQEPKNLREEFDKQLKIIKQSHDRQLSHLKEQLEKQIKNSKQAKLKWMKQAEEQRIKDRQLYEALSKKDVQKTKDLYEWQLKRKSQSYQLQIERLKKLSQLTLKSQTSGQGSLRSLQNQRQALKIRQKQLQVKIRRIEDKQTFLRQKQRAIEEREADFDRYRKRQQEKLQQQKKLIYNKQNDLQKKKIQLRKQHEEQKIHITSDLSKQQLEIARQKQQTKLEKQQLEVAKQLFEKQKKEYESFNANIMKDYKNKLKQLEQEKHYYQQKQIELYKKIHTVQLMGDLKAGAKKYQNRVRTIENEQQNINRTNEHASQVTKGPVHQNIQSKLGEPKHINNFTFSPPKEESRSRQKYDRAHAHLEDQMKSSVLNNSNTNLRDYLLKVNRDNTRMRPFIS